MIEMKSGLGETLHMNLNKNLSFAYVPNYDLRALFTTTDQDYDDAQVLDTPLEGIQDGQLTVVEVDGTLAIVSNKMAFTAQGTPTWGDQMLYSGSFIRDVGLAQFFTLNISTVTVNERGLIGWSETGSSHANNSIGVQYNPGGAVPGAITTNIGGDVLVTLFVAAISTDYKIVIVLGGYDSNGVPWKSGDTSASFLYGGHIFAKGGAMTNWTLTWSSDRRSVATLYFQFNNYSGVGTLDNIKVPTDTLEAALQPLFLDTFTGSGSIDEHTPDVDDSGNGWTQRVADADWTIDTNKGELTTAGSNPANNAADRYLYFDVSVSDFVFEADVKFEDGVNGYNGIMFRASAETSNGINCWRYQLSTNGTEYLHEIEDGSTTTRAGGAHGAVDQTFYKLTVIADGQTIKCYRDGVEKLSYTSASFNETATWMGLKVDGRALTNQAFDNVAVWLRTSSVYDVQFAKYGY